jgi:hypothetical protein
MLTPTQEKCRRRCDCGWIIDILTLAEQSVIAEVLDNSTITIVGVELKFMTHIVTWHKIYCHHVDLVVSIEYGFFL